MNTRTSPRSSLRSPLGRLARLALGERPPEPGAWQPPPYPSLFAFEAYTKDMAGRSGVFAIWHLGVRPQWLKLGAAANLLQSLRAAADGFAVYRGNGGVFAAWAYLPLDRCPGIAVALAERLRPGLQHVPITGEIMTEGAAPLPFPLPAGVSDQ